MKTKTSILLTSLTLLAGGCAVGPDYHAPAANAPAQWSEALAGGETNQAAAVAAWWQTFNDPELNSLVERAVQANLDLKIAEARVREARAQYGIAAADFGPTVDANSSFARQATSTHQPVLGSLPIPGNVPFVNNVYQAGFDASWEIDVFGGTRRAVEAAQRGPRRDRIQPPGRAGDARRGSGAQLCGRARATSNGWRLRSTTSRRKPTR